MPSKTGPARRVGQGRRREAVERSDSLDAPDAPVHPSEQHSCSAETAEEKAGMLQMSTKTPQHAAFYSAA